MAIKVKLRQKAISGNRQSLYLDFYPPIPHPETGEPTRREFLGMYLFDKAKTPTDKQHNKETLQTAEQIRQKKDNLLNKPEIYTGFELEQLKVREQGERNFVEYFKHLANKRKASNHDNWISALNYLEKFTGGTLKFADLNERVCNEFKDYLLTTKSSRSTAVNLSQNSVVSYFNKLKAALKQAYKDGLIGTDLNSKVQAAKPAETKRNYLTIEELNTLVKTDCPMPILKTAALFSALTGLRFSDIEKMTWNELEYVEGQGYFIHFKQQKTKGIEVLPISEQAYQLLGERKDPTGKVFEGLQYSAYQNRHLLKWIQAAGITKDITFHCFRHTFATLQLSEGTDIYTVSKMLGHRELKTTQIYAKIIDQTKRTAADKIKLEF
jgi:integrase